MHLKITMISFYCYYLLTWTSKDEKQVESTEKLPGESYYGPKGCLVERCSRELFDWISMFTLPQNHGQTTLISQYHIKDWLSNSQREQQAFGGSQSRRKKIRAENTYKNQCIEGPKWSHGQMTTALRVSYLKKIFKNLGQYPVLDSQGTLLEIDTH